MHLAVVAGETSGDQLGSGVLASLRGLVGDLRVTGVGGSAMAAQGLESLHAMEDISLMGLDGVTEKIFRAIRIRNSLFKTFLDDPPDVFLGIDIPDFNISLEQRLKAHRIPTAHLVSPTVWAWRSYRIRKIRKAVDRMMVLFPFEETFYRSHGVSAKFVGHPAADEIDQITRKQAREKLAGEGIQVDRTTIALLPGSRRSEIDKLGRLFLDTAERITQANSQIQFILPVASTAVVEQLRDLVDKYKGGSNVCLTEQNARLAIAAADVGLIASGTAALEAALLVRPIVVAYKVSRLSYLLARLFAKVRHVSMPNHLTEEPMVKEFLQGNANVDNLYGEIQHLLTDCLYRGQIEHAFQGLAGMLRNNANDTIAKELVSMTD
ncbi:MAG: lipid-A-disaccharide synthase [Pseudomonadota bacterium]|nr:lipid-A-disaccharide synthase [Pseudomonadota bacterium]MEC8888222.1 lipid-A-disaccharide synthase [Pseudomonadota bacterium]